MAHFPGHLREAFIDWVEDGCPEVATFEVDCEPQQAPAGEFLPKFLDCSDIMPSHICEQVATMIGWDESAAGMTYGMAAGALLIAATDGNEDAVAYLALAAGRHGDKVVTPDDVSAAQAAARRVGIPLRYALNLLPLLRTRAAAVADQLAQETAEHIVNNVIPARAELVTVTDLHVLTLDDSVPTTVEGIKASLLDGRLFPSWLDDRVVAALRVLHCPHGDSL